MLIMLLAEAPLSMHKAFNFALADQMCHPHHRLISKRGLDSWSVCA